MDTPARPARPYSRLPRAIVLCLVGGVLVGVFTEWPVWLCVVAVVGVSALLSGLLTANRPRGGDRPAEAPET